MRVAENYTNGCRTSSGHNSTLIASQLPTELWHPYLNNPTLADAILDRILHSAYRIELKGESLRKTPPKAL